MPFQQQIDKKTVSLMKRKEKTSLIKSMAIHSKTFTSLIEFVTNHLVKIEFLCHYQKQYLRYLNGPNILSYVSQIANYVSDKAHLKIDMMTVDKTITKSSNPIHLQLNNE